RIAGHHRQRGLRGAGRGRGRGRDRPAALARGLDAAKPRGRLDHGADRRRAHHPGGRRLRARARLEGGPGQPDHGASGGRLMRALLDLVRSVATVILPDTESWQEIWAVVRRNKLRALLTACGVFWGMFMLVVLLGIGNGLERGTAQSVGGLAVQAIWIWPQRTTMPHAGLGPGRPIRFKNADVAALQAVPGVEVVAPRHRLGGWRVGVTVTAGAKTSTFNVVGDVPGLLEVEPLMVAAGRFINRNDLDQRRKVAVIGEQVRDILFGEGVDPRGQYLQVRGIFFQVVGAVKSLQSGDEAEKVAASVFVPLPTFQQAFNQPDSIGW